MKPIYTLDAETDPFKQGRVPLAFCWGLYRESKLSRDGKGVFEYTWGKECTKEIVDRLYELEPGIIYIHNGGRFDVYYLLSYVLAGRKRLQIVGNRIIKCYLQCRDGWHEIRDSWKVFNLPLSKYKKTEISYEKFEKQVREQNKEEILSYLKDDCRFLHQIMMKFLKHAGSAYLTVGTWAMHERKKFYDTGDGLDFETDTELRHQYYFGARVQCFEKGVIECKDGVTAYDVNSMYPYSMAEFEHPVGLPSYGNKVRSDTFFVTVEGTNKGALPFRDEFGEISFDKEYGIFHCSIYEYITACELGLFKGKVLECVNFKRSLKFDKFVNHFYAIRQAATEAMDKEEEYSAAWYEHKLDRELFKLLLNNSYGKDAINPENYFEWDVSKVGDSIANMERMSLTCSGCCEIVGTSYRQFACGGWHMATLHEPSGYKLWKKPSNTVKLNNVATGASVTGAARSVLLRGLHSVGRPLYCDTDSIICAGDVTLDIHASKLGAWKLEKQGDKIAIYGKKGYNLSKGGVSVKSACKGVRLSPDEIDRVASGEVIKYFQEAPTFGLDGGATFISREVRMT